MCCAAKVSQTEKQARPALCGCEFVQARTHTHTQGTSVVCRRDPGVCWPSFFFFFFVAVEVGGGDGVFCGRLINERQSRDEIAYRVWAGGCLEWERKGVGRRTIWLAQRGAWRLGPLRWVAELQLGLTEEGLHLPSLRWVVGNQQPNLRAAPSTSTPSVHGTSPRYRRAKEQVESIQRTISVFLNPVKLATCIRACICPRIQPYAGILPAKSREEMHPTQFACIG